MTTIINIKTDPRVKTKAKKTASDLGLSLSGVINAYLRQFIRNKTLFVSSRHEEPSEFLKQAIREAEEDRKHNRQISFPNASEAVKFLEKLSTKNLKFSKRRKYAKD